MTAPTLGLAAAAKACGVSESTLRRKRTDLLELGAVQGAKGWQIPIPALIQLGLMENSTPPTVEAPERAPEKRVEAFTLPLYETPSHEVETLKKKLAEAEQRAAVAEAIAEERERIIRVQEQALRMLEAAPVTAPAPRQEERPAPVPEQAGKKRSWWRW